MATAEQQLLSSMNPQMARLLDEQLAGQQLAANAPRGYEGLMRAAGQTAAMAGNVGRQALGLQAQPGMNEQQMMLQQQAQQEAQAQTQAQLSTVKEQALSLLNANPSLEQSQKSALAKAIQADTTGQLSSKVIDKYGFSEAEPRYKVAGNKVFDTKSGVFITDPLTADDKTKAINVNFKKITGLDEKRFTRESWQAANDIMIDPTLPLTERIVDAKKALVVKDEEMNPELEEYLVSQLEEYDPKGLNNRFSVINDQVRLLGSGIISGFGAPALTTLATIGQRFGILNSEQAQTLSNTQTFDSNAGNLVAEVIKAFGAGTGLSDADREYATKIAGGLISLEELSLKKILELTQRRSIAEAKAYNNQLSKLGQDWMVQAVETPRFKRLTLKEDPFIQQVEMPDGTIRYIDTNPKGYTNETYDAEGYLVE